MSCVPLGWRRGAPLYSPPEAPAGGGSPPPAYELLAAYPFGASMPSAGKLAPDLSGGAVPARSTVQALEKVEFSPLWDLKGQRAYPGARIERVWLRRCRAPGSVRDGICVFCDHVGNPSSAEKDPPRLLGALRPVQRFVLAAGLARVQRLASLRQEHDGLDPWGFVRVRGTATKPVTITPPIIERLHSYDWDDASGAEEFVICDGTHRVVQRCWIDGKPVPALAVLPGQGQLDLPQPYYARPLGRLDWGQVSQNRLSQTPAVLEEKYGVRAVSPHDLLDPAIVHAVETGEVAAETLYRRYFRDLETGFGSLGGQGGRDE